MNNFLITYDTDQLYSFFSDTGEACKISVFIKKGAENFPEIFPSITFEAESEQDEYYVRDMLNVSLKTKEFILDGFEEDSKTFELPTDEWVAFYDETSFALRESGNLDYTFNITEEGQVNIEVIGPVTEQIMVQLIYGCGFPLIEGETYKVEINDTPYEFEAKVRDDRIYLGDYSAFFGEEPEEPIEPDKETIIIDSKMYAEVNSYVTYSEDEETKYKVTFNKSSDNPVEYIVASAQTTIQQEGQELLIAYVGNLNIYDEGAPSTEEPFFIYTVQSEDEEGQIVYTSYLYVREAGTYKLKVESYKTNEIPALKGAALVSFANMSGSEIDDNYGIGINSSDQGLTLPERAISLFETELDESSNSNKIKFNYRGILGTLPPANKIGMTDSEVYRYLAKQQGIFTNNMYIGDKDQYLAYYTDSDDNYKKKLKVTGGITATSLTIDSDGNIYNGIDAINISGYSLTITIEENSSLAEGYVYLYPHLYHNGVEQLPEIGKETEFYSNFVWYENDVLKPSQSDPTHNGRTTANREYKYRLTYSFADGATEGAQPIKTITVEPTEYITDIGRNGIKIHPKDWTSDSHYIQLNGEGMYIKESNGIDLAKFKDTVTLGIDDGSQSYMYLDYHSLQMIEKEGNTYLHISDLRKKDGYLHITFTGDGVTDTFNLENKIIVDYRSITATVDDEPVQLQNLGLLEYKISPVPPNESTIVFKVEPTTKDKTLVKAYTLGKRKADTVIGPMSYAEGIDVTSSGLASHAEGYNTWANEKYSHVEGNGCIALGLDAHAEGFESEASGHHSHAEGYNTYALGNSSHTSGYKTITSEDYQFACGSYNSTDDDEYYLFMVGNGTAEDKRSNAFTVDWYGNFNAGVKEYTEDDFTYYSGFTYVSTETKYMPSATKFGRVVTLSGIFLSTTTQSSTGGKVIGAVPVGCEPLQTIRVLQKGGGLNKYLLEIAPTGTITASLYGTTTETPIPNAAWLHIGTTYISKT